MDSSSNNPHSNEKNWLIRTRQRQILGPVSKAKLIEFVKKGALSPEDEIASGNGYWFAISEKDLVDKYLFGDLPQGFNPISEAPSVLTVRGDKENTSSINPRALPGGTDKRNIPPKSSPVDDVVLPKEDDLAYPDLDNMNYPDSGPRVDDDKAPDSTLVITLDDMDDDEQPTQKVSATQQATSSDDEPEEITLPDEDDLEYPE